MKKIFIPAILFILISPICKADIYKCKDDDGRTQYYDDDDKRRQVLCTTPSVTISHRTEAQKAEMRREAAKAFRKYKEQAAREYSEKYEQQLDF